MASLLPASTKAAMNTSLNTFLVKIFTFALLIIAFQIVGMFTVHLLEIRSKEVGKLVQFIFTALGCLVAAKVVFLR
jgi:hypothetical protein